MDTFGWVGVHGFIYLTQKDVLNIEVLPGEFTTAGLSCSWWSILECSWKNVHLLVSYPISSMGLALCICTWLMFLFMVNVGKYTPYWILWLWTTEFVPIKVARALPRSSLALWINFHSSLKAMGARWKNTCQNRLVVSCGSKRSFWEIYLVVSCLIMTTVV